MSTLDAPIDAPRPRRAFSARVENLGLRLLGIGGGIVLIEPSPYEFLFFLCLFVFAVGGLALHRSSLPMVGLLALFNLGGIFSLIPFIHDADARMFIGVSVYLMLTSVFFATIVLERGSERFAALAGGLIGGGVIASTAGILGYFDIAGLGASFTLHGRAAGTFKDPNVLGTFVILPLVLLAQNILLGRGRLSVNVVLFSLILFGGVFLSFSRGAWGSATGSLLMMASLTFLFSADARLRARMVLAALVVPILGLGALAAALSVEPIRVMIEERASLQQEYDVGPTGRFGNQARAAPTLLTLPNGYGPLQFRHHWPEDPHNVYMNAFASYGWLGGISYLALVLATLVVGFTVVTRRFSLQPIAIAIWSTLLVQMLLGFIIDTDKWRHFYLLLGLTWGLFALSRLEEKPSNRRDGTPRSPT